MNKSEALEVTGMLMAAWPRENWEEPTIALWQGFMLDLQSIDVEKAVEALIKEREYCPTISVVRSRTKDFTRARIAKEADETQRKRLEAGYASPETNKANVARLKEMIARGNIGRKVP